MGGPHSASRKWATTKVVARFLPFLLPQPPLTPGIPTVGGLFSIFNASATTTTSLASKRETEVVLSSVSTDPPSPPPPLRPNVRWRWSFQWFQLDCHHHHLPCVQTRDGGGSFSSFDPIATTTTSLASKRELEVVLSSVSTDLQPPPPPSRPNARRR